MPLALAVIRLDDAAWYRRVLSIGSALFLEFADKQRAAVYHGRKVTAFFGLARAASRKLDQLDAAIGLRGLARPGNRLEALRGRRKGQWSIRINDQ